MPSPQLQPYTTQPKMLLSYTPAARKYFVFCPFPAQFPASISAYEIPRYMQKEIPFLHIGEPDHMQKALPIVPNMIHFSGQIR